MAAKWTVSNNRATLIPKEPEAGTIKIATRSEIASVKVIALSNPLSPVSHLSIQIIVLQKLRLGEHLIIRAREAIMASRLSVKPRWEANGMCEIIRSPHRWVRSLWRKSTPSHSRMLSPCTSCKKNKSRMSNWRLRRKILSPKVVMPRRTRKQRSIMSRSKSKCCPK